MTFQLAPGDAASDGAQLSRNARSTSLLKRMEALSRDILHLYTQSESDAGHLNPLVQVATQQSEPHERPSTSLGLGLFIAREIVTGHGGTVAVTSTAAEGTASTVHLPRTAAKPQGQQSGRNNP